MALNVNLESLTISLAIVEKKGTGCSLNDWAKKVLVYGKSNKDTCSVDKRGTEIEKTCKDSENSKWVQAPAWIS